MRKLNNHNENDLMQGFCQGIQDAFDEIFHRLYPALCYYGFKITGDQAVSEDIAGEAFIKVWERRVDCKHFLSLKAYLYTTVRNASIDWLRKNQAQAKNLKGILPLLEQAEQSGQELLIMTETCRLLHAAINGLPAQCQKVVRLSYLDGKTLKQVAAELHIEVGTVQSQKNRGLMLLRKRLKYFLHSFL
ncbi:MAG: RNA polymerase sigma-70 factor [Chitinophagaceae bacterium]